MGTLGNGFPIPGMDENWGGDQPEQDPEVQQLIDKLQPWRQAGPPGLPPDPEEPDWTQLSQDEYLNDHPPIDFHNDPQAQDAILPQSPAPAWFRDSSHPQHGSRLGKLMQVMAAAGMGALAGRAANEQMVAQSGGHRSGGVGVGFQYGMAAVQNLQNLQAQRRAMQDVSDYRRARTAQIQAQTAGLPAQQAGLSAYRQARIDWVHAQTAKLDAQAQNLKKAPNDKMVHFYNGADQKVHFVYQTPSGNTYEKTSEQNFYQKPDKPPAPPHPLLAHGHDGIYLIDPVTTHAKKVISYPPNTPLRRASADYFRKVDNWKSSEERKIMNDSMLTDDERMQRLQEMQDHYERAIATGGGDVNHYDVRFGYAGQPGQPALPQAGTSKNDPLGIR